MKRVFSFLLIIAILCTMTIPCFAANPSVSVKTQNAVAGETITVSVNLSANSGLAGLQFAVNFNSEYFQLVSGSATTSGLFSALPVEKSSSVEYAGVSVAPVNSGGTVLSFKLKVLKTGGKISISIIDAINGENQKVTVSASGATVNCSHSNAKWVVTKKPTCIEKGIETKECSCGDKQTRDIAVTEHNFGGWKIIKEATETEKGTKERVCKVCSKKEKVEIAKVGVTEKQTETQTEIQQETQTEIESQVETTTEVNQETPKRDVTPIIIGAVLFVIGVGVGIIVTFFITKRKEKEEE